jgi:hypothetical protein
MNESRTQLVADFFSGTEINLSENIYFVKPVYSQIRFFDLKFRAFDAINQAIQNISLRPKLKRWTPTTN